MSKQVLQNTTPEVPVNEIKTRLGNIGVTPETTFQFENGIYGFDKCHSFVVAPLPNIPEEHNYVVMHCLDDMETSFIVKVIGSGAEIDETFVKKLDVKLSMLSLGLDIDETMCGLLVIIDEDMPQGQRVSFNLDGPLIFCLRTQRAWQTVLNH